MYLKKTTGLIVFINEFNLINKLGGGLQNAYTRKGTYSIPLRANLHFAEYVLHHWIVGSGVALTDGINNTDDDFTQTNVSVDFGSILYQKDIQSTSGAYFRKKRNREVLIYLYVRDSISFGSCL